jgi:hypothetical protein
MCTHSPHRPCFVVGGQVHVNFLPLLRRHSRRRELDLLLLVHLDGRPPLPLKGWLDL